MLNWAGGFWSQILKCALQLQIMCNKKSGPVLAWDVATCHWQVCMLVGQGMLPLSSSVLHLLYIKVLSCISNSSQAHVFCFNRLQHFLSCISYTSQAQTQGLAHSYLGVAGICPSRSAARCRSKFALKLLCGLTMAAPAHYIPSTVSRPFTSYARRCDMCDYSASSASI